MSKSREGGLNENCCRQERERKKIKKKETKTGERKEERKERERTYFASNGSLKGRLTIA